MTQQEVSDTAGTACGGEGDLRLKKAAVERNRKWLHRLAWPALFVTVLTTESSIHDPSVAVLLGFLGCALVTAGTVGRLWCGLYLFGRKSKEFCQDGPYSICRNPLYVSAFLNILGLALASRRAILMIALPVILGAYYLSVIKAEERRMSVLFGRDYEAYCASTPRIIPRLEGYRPRATIALDPDHYLRGIVKAMGYFWLLFLLQLAESL